MPPVLRRRQQAWPRGFALVLETGESKRLGLVVFCCFVGVFFLFFFFCSRLRPCALTSLRAQPPPAPCCSKRGENRQGEMQREQSEPPELYFSLRAGRETKLALGAAAFIKERWVEHNLPSSSWPGIKAKNLAREQQLLADKIKVC